MEQHVEYRQDGSRTTATLVERETNDEVLFGGNHLAAEIDKRADDLFDALGTTREQHAEIKQNFDALRKDTGLAEGVMATIASARFDADCARARATDLAAHDAQVQAAIVRSNPEIRERARALFGEDAQQVLEDTIDYVATHPQLQKVLEGGVGNRLDIATELAFHVRRIGHRAPQRPVTEPSIIDAALRHGGR